MKKMMKISNDKAVYSIVVDVEEYPIIIEPFSKYRAKISNISDYIYDCDNVNNVIKSIMKHKNIVCFLK